MDDPTAPLPSTTTTTAITATRATTTATTTAITQSIELTIPVTSAPISERQPIVIERLDSPANAVAQMTGTGARATDPVTVDGKPADVLSFVGDAADSGNFSVQVWIEDQGAHTVCVATSCGRVYTLAPNAESPEEMLATIEQALILTDEYLDYETEFPDWTVEVGGALSGTGGTTDVDTQTVTIYRNRGRSVDDYVRTILHEFGHVADAERLDDAERAVYLALRGINPSVVWRDAQAHRLEDWARQPSEDFAEVMVMFWTSGRWEPRTTELAASPDAGQLASIAALID
jgi:hypothetical protein